MVFWVQIITDHGMGRDIMGIRSMRKRIMSIRSRSEERGGIDLQSTNRGGSLIFLGILDLFLHYSPSIFQT